VDIGGQEGAGKGMPDKEGGQARGGPCKEAKGARGFPTRADPAGTPTVLIPLC